MNHRRRLLLEGLKGRFIFLEGSGEIINNAGSYTLRETNVGSFIGVNAPEVAVVGSNDRTEQGYGFFKIPVDFTGYEKLYIETESGFTIRNIRSAVGYSANYSGSVTSPRLPDVNEIIETGSARTVRQFDISNVNGIRFVVGTVIFVSSLSNNTNALKIYNIWLE